MFDPKVASKYFNNDKIFCNVFRNLIEAANGKQNATVSSWWLFQINNSAAMAVMINCNMKQFYRLIQFYTKPFCSVLFYYSNVLCSPRKTCKFSFCKVYLKVFANCLNPYMTINKLILILIVPTIKHNKWTAG